MAAPKLLSRRTRRATEPRASHRPWRHTKLLRGPPWPSESSVIKTLAPPLPAIGLGVSAQHPSAGLYLLVHRLLCSVRVLQPREAIVPPHGAQAGRVRRAGQPFPAVQTNLDGEGEPVPRVTGFAVLLRLVWHGGGAGQPGSEPGRINDSGHQDRCTAILTG